MLYWTFYICFVHLSVESMKGWLLVFVITHYTISLNENCGLLLIHHTLHTVQERKRAGVALTRKAVSGESTVWQLFWNVQNDIRTVQCAFTAQWMFSMILYTQHMPSCNITATCFQPSIDLSRLVWPWQRQQCEGKAPHYNHFKMVCITRIVQFALTENVCCDSCLSLLVHSACHHAPKLQPAVNPSQHMSRG